MPHPPSPPPFPGVTVWEILTFGARPYKDKKPQEMLKYLESGQRLVQPPTCTIDLYKVLLKCETFVLALWCLLASCDNLPRPGLLKGLHHGKVESILSILP